MEYAGSNPAWGAEKVMEHKLYALWEDIADHVGQRTIKEQTNALAVFNGWYKKSNVHEQGNFHQLVHKRNKPDCNCSECEKDRKG